jgi:hypothetical protein
MSLTELLHARATATTDIRDIADRLDRATPEARLSEVFALDRAGQRALFQCAQLAITPDHFVPLAVGAGRAVHHRGKNTLPLPGKHRQFEKRFCRPAESAANGVRLFGYNEAPSRGLVGPGYFVAYATDACAAQPAWRERGGVVVDYFQMPDGAVPSEWPKVVPNTQGIQRFVYNGTRDFMRRVSEHVSIGAAYKGEKALDHYFVLVRQDV